MSRKFRSKKQDFFDKLDLSSFDSATPSCPHFGECGGCRFQIISYDSQVQIKKDFLSSLFNQDVDVIPSLYDLGYRNRMDFVYTKAKHGIHNLSNNNTSDLLGFRKKGDFKTVIDLHDCFLIPSFANEIFKSIKSLLFSFKIPSYDFIDHVGFLRYVTLRIAPSSGEVMVIFTSAPFSDKSEESLFNNFLSEVSNIDGVSSIYWFVNPEITDVAVPDVPAKLIIGKEDLIETIGDTSLSFGPKSFFQANSNMSKVMFDEIKNHVSGNVVDLCCGVGAISLYVRDVAKSIVGIEQVPSAIDFAKSNMVLNDVSNAHFFALDMKKILDVVPMEVNTLIVDPPRSGLDKKVVSKILELAPDKIIYMSCNPKTQKTDIDMLVKDGEYEVTFLKGYDMFSQTSHVETLAVLNRTD